MMASKICFVAIFLISIASISEVALARWEVTESSPPWEVSAITSSLGATLTCKPQDIYMDFRCYPTHNCVCCRQNCIKWCGKSPVVDQKCTPKGKPGPGASLDCECCCKNMSPSPPPPSPPPPSPPPPSPPPPPPPPSPPPPSPPPPPPSPPPPSPPPPPPSPPPPSPPPPPPSPPPPSPSPPPPSPSPPPPSPPPPSPPPPSPSPPPPSAPINICRAGEDFIPSPITSCSLCTRDYCKNQCSARGALLTRMACAPSLLLCRCCCKSLTLPSSATVVGSLATQ